MPDESPTCLYRPGGNVSLASGTSANDCEWLEEWYAAQCDGHWENSRGLSIQSMENPGWWVKIDLVGTDLEPHAKDAEITTIGIPHEATRPYAPESEQSTDWMLCRIKDGRFDGAGDPTKLRAILQTFREWAVARETGGE
jgi:hypothetical protein